MNYILTYLGTNSLRLLIYSQNFLQFVLEIFEFESLLITLLLSKKFIASFEFEPEGRWPTSIIRKLGMKLSYNTLRILVILSIFAIVSGRTIPLQTFHITGPRPHFGWLYPAPYQAISTEKLVNNWTNIGQNWWPKPNLGQKWLARTQLNKKDGKTMQSAYCIK